jgi:hypothetical protein
MSAGNQPVVVPGGRIDQRTQLALAAPTKKIELRYNLRGITIRSIPSRYGLVLLIKVSIFGLMLLMGNEGRKYAARAAFRFQHQPPDVPVRAAASRPWPW